MSEKLSEYCRRQASRPCPEDYGFNVEWNLAADDALALEAKLEAKEDALRQIAQWSDAYPLDIFPEPDFQRASALLMAGGMTLDAISASNMRHVVEGVGQMAKAALADQQEGRWLRS